VETTYKGDILVPCDYWGCTLFSILDVFYGRPVPDTAAHESSMLQDITAGKRTEIDALNGAVIQLAQEHGVPVLYNLAVYNLVKFLESSRRD
jgi:2-dehydropantoate 2-reductase